MGYSWVSWETAESYFRIFRTTGELMGSGVEWMGDISFIVIVFLSLSLLLYFLGNLQTALSAPEFISPSLAIPFFALVSKVGYSI